MSVIVTDLSADRLPWRVAAGFVNTYTITLTLNGSAYSVATKVFSLQIRRVGSEENFINLTEGSGITNGGASGIITITLSAAQSATLGNDQFTWQLSVSPDSTRWFSGTITSTTGPADGDTATSVSVSLSLAGSNVTATISLSFVNWGGIGGTLSDQTDLSAALALKAALTQVIGTQDLFVPASAMWPRTTGGCAALAKTEMTTSLFNIQSLDFDQTTQEFAQFQISLPRNWNNGTVTAKVYWTAASGSGGVVWGISGGAYSDDDALTVALGTAQTCTDTLISTNDLHISPVSSAITLAGTPADSDFLAFQISRNVSDGSDTLSGDAKLLGILITLTTDAAIAS